MLSFPPPRSEVAALTDSAHKMMARKHDARIVVALDSCIMEMKRVFYVVMLISLHFLCEVPRSSTEPTQSHKRSQKGTTCEYIFGPH